MMRALLALLAVASVPAAATAQVIAYEGFNYNNSGSLNGVGGGSGWATAWNTNYPTQFTIPSGSLTSPGNDLATTGNRVDLAGNTSEFRTATRSLSTDLSQAGSVWLSFVITRTGGSVGSYGGVVIGNDPGTSNNTGRLFIGDPGSNDAWNLERAGGGAITNSNHVLTDFPKALLVVNIQFGLTTSFDAVHLYVNPPVGGAVPSTTAADFTNFDVNPGGIPVTDVGIWYSGDANYQIDEIRVGHTYADVTPAPEPAAVLALAAVGLVGVGGVRRSLRRPGERCSSVSSARPA